MEPRGATGDMLPITILTAVRWYIRLKGLVSVSGIACGSELRCKEASATSFLPNRPVQQMVPPEETALWIGPGKPADEPIDDIRRH
jgi:hypothetical protein